jgi:AcrR family transcriptional regulator
LRAVEATKTRELSGEKAQRIVEAMRSSVARRGISGSTFEHVAREAGVSRGLLHYYFGTKEALLVEVVRRDTEHRIARLNEPLAAAGSADELLAILVADLEDSIQNDPGFWVLLFDLFTAGRRNPEIQREVAELFNRTRDAWGAHVAIHVGNDRAIHLCRRVGLAAVWPLAQFAEYPEYRVLLGGKRALRANSNGSI